MCVVFILYLNLSENVCLINPPRCVVSNKNRITALEVLNMHSTCLFWYRRWAFLDLFCCIICYLHWGDTNSIRAIYRYVWQFAAQFMCDGSIDFIPSQFHNAKWQCCEQQQQQQQNIHTKMMGHFKTHAFTNMHKLKLKNSTLVPSNKLLNNPAAVHKCNIETDNMR